jgi:hypothetical protein
MESGGREPRSRPAAVDEDDSKALRVQSHYPFRLGCDTLLHGQSPFLGFQARLILAAHFSDCVRLAFSFHLQKRAAERRVGGGPFGVRRSGGLAATDLGVRRQSGKMAAKRSGGDGTQRRRRFGWGLAGSRTVPDSVWAGVGRVRAGVADRTNPKRRRRPWSRRNRSNSATWGLCRRTPRRGPRTPRRGARTPERGAPYSTEATLHQSGEGSKSSNTFTLSIRKR